MRILGAILLISGFLLCLTIVWAAIGFLAMGVGLICLLIAERRQEQIKQLHSAVAANVELDLPEVANVTSQHALAPIASPPELPKAEQPQLHAAGLGSPILPPTLGIKEERSTAVAAARRLYDAERHCSITTDDADVPRLANVANPSAMEYVDPSTETDPSLHDRTSRPAAIGLDPFRGLRNAVGQTGNAGDLPGTAPRGDRAVTSEGFAHFLAAQGGDDEGGSSAASLAEHSRGRGTAKAGQSFGSRLKVCREIGKTRGRDFSKG